MSVPVIQQLVDQLLEGSRMDPFPTDYQAALLRVALKGCTWDELRRAYHRAVWEEMRRRCEKIRRKYPEFPACSGPYGYKREQARRSDLTLSGSLLRLGDWYDPEYKSRAGTRVGLLGRRIRVVRPLGWITRFGPPGRYVYQITKKGEEALHRYDVAKSVKEY